EALALACQRAPAHVTLPNIDAGAKRERMEYGRGGLKGRCIDRLQPRRVFMFDDEAACLQKHVCMPARSRLEHLSKHAALIVYERILHDFAIEARNLCKI